ncbi:zinc finger MYM-type protein 3-like [Haliotis rubra]|uniref:zinc finger MYM-type protein 3-like n=1 Tax=Haliotis rubra TaxID=36100 RepID=UPI001EE5A911|nr:zinc finger MYM-type protein 3-like [Haliotis rubra]
MSSEEEYLFITQKSYLASTIDTVETSSNTRPYFEEFSDISDCEFVSTCQQLETRMEQNVLHQNGHDMLDFAGDICDAELISTCEIVEKDVVKTTSKPTNMRFRAPKTDTEISSLGHRSTMTKIQWAVKTFKEWQHNRNRLADQRNISPILVDIEDMTCDELNYSISRFICEVKKVDGCEYPPDTLYSFVICLQLYMDTLDRCFKLLSDDSFSQIRNTLDNVMETNSRTCKTKRQAQVITLEEEDVLWSAGCLGSNTPAQLLDTLAYLIGLHFALRGGQEHRGDASQLQVCESSNGRYLLYTERTSKSNSGGLKHRRVENTRVVAYENAEKPDRCVVALFEKYLAHCPSTTKTDAFYLRPLVKPTGDVWYVDQPLGRHKRQSFHAYARLQVCPDTAQINLSGHQQLVDSTRQESTSS